MATKTVPQENVSADNQKTIEVTGVLILYNDGRVESIDTALVKAVSWTDREIAMKPENRTDAAAPICKWVDPPGIWDCGISRPTR